MPRNNNISLLKLPSSLTLQTRETKSHRLARLHVSQKRKPRPESEGFRRSLSTQQMSRRLRANPINTRGSNGQSLMDIDEEQRRRRRESEDPFLAFVDYARSVLFPEEDKEEGGGGGGYGPDGFGSETSGPGWSWIVSRILKTCIAYSSGVTAAILLSELSQAWSDQQRSGRPKKRLETLNQLKNKHRRSTNIYMLTLGDIWSSNTIELYLHRRYYDLVDTHNGILKKGREVFVTGCHLRTAREGCVCPRLLPTEYLVISLDDDQDDDAMLIAAQFCSDSFSSISLSAVNSGVSYSLYARIESIVPVEVQGVFGSVQQKQITLVDNDGSKMKFLLWGEQVLLANLFSVGSMIGLDRPYISTSVDGAAEANNELCLEYGSATQLYLVPFIQHEEQICVRLTQNQYQGSKLMNAEDPSQVPKVSQVTLFCDSQGSIDFSNYPFQSLIVDLCDKMTGFSLYGVVIDMFCEREKEIIFSLKIEDSTGAVWAKLHFARSWSLGRLGLGHTVYISGLSCHVVKNSSLEVFWFENNNGASFVNISCLAALLNSSCLHKLSCLADLSSESSCTYICRVRLDQVDQCHVNTRFSHSLCGHVVNKNTNGIAECSFCHCNCDTAVTCTFQLKITLADDSGKIFAWSTGQTATELLQISPDEFHDLPEEEQFMYPSSLENESFIVALVNCKRQDYGLGQSLSSDAGVVLWEIACALRCE